MRLIRSRRVVAHSVLVPVVAIGCDTPSTTVVLDNDYPAASTNAFVVHVAFWQAVAFPTPVPPGSSSEPQFTVAASANAAYVVIAPGWDPTSAAPPISFVVLESKAGFELHFDHTLHIPVDDATFVGNCAAGSFLSQAQTDFITQRVFPSEFAALAYDAATCTTSVAP